MTDLKHKEAMENEKPAAAKMVCSVRLMIAILAFFGFMCMNAQRTAIGVAIVCMVNHTALGQDDVARLEKYNITGNFTDSYMTNISNPIQSPEAIDEDCPAESLGNNTDKTTEDGEFAWTKPQQGLALGAFFWGYMISQIPGGWLAGRIGGSKVLGIFMIVVSIASILTPVAARASFYFFIVLRVLAGFGAGVTYPAMHALWGQWAPPLERSTLAGIGYAGSQLGNVIGLTLSGLLCEYGFDGGWPSIFYIFGSMGALWAVIWLILVADSPEEAKHISEKERMYIHSCLSGQTADHAKHKPSFLEIPWVAILTSPAVWAIVVGNTCGDYGLYTFETCLPTYLKEVLRFDIKSNGLFSALPFLCFWFMILLTGYMADLVRAKGILTTGNTRKACEAFGKLIPAFMLIGLGFMDCTLWKFAVVLLIIGVGCSGIQWSGYLVNHVDIAPEYAGILMGISNCIACVSGIAGPFMVQSLTKNQTRHEWQTVFFIIAAVLAFGAIFFAIFGKGELQPWARQKSSKEASVENLEEQYKMIEGQNGSALNDTGPTKV